MTMNFFSSFFFFRYQIAQYPNCLLHICCCESDAEASSFETSVHVMSQASNESIRFGSVADTICIVLLTHFNDTVRDVMSMIKVIGSRWCRRAAVAVVIVVEGRRCCLDCERRRRRRCLTVVHALKLIDIQIIVVIILMKLLLLLMMIVMTNGGLCAPAFRYPRSFWVWRVWRVVIGKMR